ncbi:MAG: hypothetical protein J7647_25890 [Cyanobacteria bacterium SBLK]|nr:hypothetical protein [Cyanobacteria bacterium SBLK]
MSQTITKEDLLLERFNLLSSERQQQLLNFAAFLLFQEKQQHEENEGAEQEPISFLESAKDLIGRVDGGPGDLATNKEYLKRLGSK